MESLGGSTENLLALLKRHWGYDAFLPGQSRAIEALVSGRDALAVLPTGGGKSVIYQLPALALPGLAVVVSPLLALMKDQVDALRAMDIPATSLDSSSSAVEKEEIIDGLRQGRFKLLYVSPERLASSGMLAFLQELSPSFFAIDEAHCVSQWGHEFRADYRSLGILRRTFPSTPVLACTATATEEVRSDVAKLLGLRDPEIVVEDFDRPNLTYRAVFRRDLHAQVNEVLSRHTGEAGIIYCIRRRDTEELAGALVSRGHRARPYHAGLDQQARRDTQQAFAEGRIDVVVATVAFGMGIDRSNVRFVVHSAMPKSVEAYQQEAGRAGRDRLPAECVLLYSPEDLNNWQRIMGPPKTEYEHHAHGKVEQIYQFSRSVTCRHAGLVKAFGQAWTKESCNACDVCLGEHTPVEDSTTLARKLLSGVARLEGRFGARYVADVLHGSGLERVRTNGHDRLSTFGLLSSASSDDIVDWLDQLVALGHLNREREHRTLQLTDSGVAAMKGGVEVRLATPVEPVSETSSTLTPEEIGLRERLTVLRRELAVERNLPEWTLFGDPVLRDLARERPQTIEALKNVAGLGEAKVRDLGDKLVESIQAFCVANGLTEKSRTPRRRSKDRANPVKEEAVAALKRGRSVAEVAQEFGRAPSTVAGYLAEFIAADGIHTPEPWVSTAVYERVVHAASRVNASKMSPIFAELNSEVSFDEIKVALAVHANVVARQAASTVAD